MSRKANMMSLKWQKIQPSQSSWKQQQQQQQQKKKTKKKQKKKKTKLTATSRNNKKKRTFGYVRPAKIQISLRIFDSQGF